jgi:predicted cupin superfamily sugar epimerase
MTSKPADPQGTGASGRPKESGREVVQPTAPEVIANLDLRPHREGGYFRETYRASASVPTAEGDRPTSTAILYLLTTTEPSRFHRLRSDEVWFYHAGALCEMVLLKPREGGAARHGRSDQSALMPEHRVVGPGSPCALVPGGWWMAARTISGEEADWGAGRAPERRWTADRRANRDGGWTLVSCLVTPGFEYEDFELADRDELLRDYPHARELILALT